MTADFFDYTISTTPLIEGFRFLTALLGFWVFCAALHRFLSHVLYATGILCMALGLFTAFQQLAVLGESLEPWRLPLLIVMNTAAAVHLYRPDGAHHATR